MNYVLNDKLPICRLTIRTESSDHDPVHDLTPVRQATSPRSTPQETRPDSPACTRAAYAPARAQLGCIACPSRAAASRRND